MGLASNSTGSSGAMLRQCPPSLHLCHVARSHSIEVDHWRVANQLRHITSQVHLGGLASRRSGCGNACSGAAGRAVAGWSAQCQQCLQEGNGKELNFGVEGVKKCGLEASASRQDDAYGAAPDLYVNGFVTVPCSQ